MKTFWKKYLRPALVLSVLLTILTGFIYPGIVTGIAQLIFPYQANGSLHYQNGKVVGSDLIGQYWTDPKYFHGRPSATFNPSGTPSPYEADNSGASNAGPTSVSYIQTVQQRVTDLRKEYCNSQPCQVPDDLVTASASGLDPDISITAAQFQAPVVAQVRGLPLKKVQDLISSHETGRFLGIFGEPYINVLDLNLALDSLK